MHKILQDFMDLVFDTVIRGAWLRKDLTAPVEGEFLRHIIDVNVVQVLGIPLR